MQFVSLKKLYYHTLHNACVDCTSCNDIKMSDLKIHGNLMHLCDPYVNGWFYLIDFINNIFCLEKAIYSLKVAVMKPRSDKFG